jgi:hypothetical protein
MKDSMEKIASSRNPVEELLLKIPGFQGYLNKEYRRESDKLHRMYLAEKLDTVKRSIGELQTSLVDEGRIKALSAFDKLVNKLDATISRLKYADQGYSGFFDTVKIDDRELEIIHQLDLDLVNEVTKVEQTAGKLDEGLDDGDLKATIKVILGVLSELNAKFKEREEAVTGVI